MGLGGILQELKTEGVLALYHDYRSGRAFDYSGNGNGADQLIAPSVRFTKKGIASNNSLYPRVINTPSLQALTIGTIIVKQQTYVTSNAYAIYKNNQFVLNHNSALSLMTFSSNVAAATTPFVGGNIAVHGVDFDNAGGIPKYYINGSFYANMGAGLTIVSSVDPIYVCFNASTSYSNCAYLLLFSRKLTATEHARLYGQLENTTWNTKGLPPGPMMP